jgi:mannose-6-phosphate isomerase-like protein (cupin superfamily)
VSRSRYHVRPSDVAPYAPANHTGTRNFRLIGRETVGAKQVEMLIGEIERGRGALPHAHPGIEQVCYLLEGAARVEVGGEAFVLAPGEACFFPADMGEDDRDFKWNNYISRYHTRHLDLMDLLAMFTGRANAPLDEMARLCGFPGKLGMDGSKVWQAWRDGQIASIRDYCETDVANTWLLYCRFQLINGRLSQEEYQGEISLFRETIAELQGAHWADYLAAWPG